MKRFLNLPSGTIFEAIKRIRADATKALNREAVTFFYGKKFISDWDAKFYIDTCAKRSLSVKQVKIRTEINGKVLAKLQAESRRLLASRTA